MRRSKSASGDIVILMGSKGAGKSTFIDIATKQGGSEQQARHGLGSGTVEIQCTPYSHPRTRQPFVFVDTPGFNHDSMDTRIMLDITSWLKKTHKRTKVVRIVYLHRISDNRLVEPPLRPLRKFASFLDNCKIGGVVLATTMWHPAGDQERANDRQDELRIEHWNSTMDVGCQIASFTRTFESAWNILDMLTDTSEAIHEFLLERKEGETPPESINSAADDRKKTLLERCKRFLERAMFRINLKE